MVKPINDDHDTLGLPLAVDTPSRNLLESAAVDGLSSTELLGETRNRVITLVIMNIRLERVDELRYTPSTDSRAFQDSAVRSLATLANPGAADVATNAAMSMEIKLSEAKRDTEPSLFIRFLNAAGWHQAEQTKATIHLDERPGHALVQTLIRIEYYDNVALFRVEVCCHTWRAEDQTGPILIIIDPQRSTGMDHGHLPTLLKLIWKKSQ